MSKCDCKNETCEGAFCFVKIERFPDDDVSSILKGCVDYVAQDMIGCQHAGDNHSIECYCNGNDMCNTVEHLNNYEAKILPKIQCCDCNPNGARKMCRFDACLQTCKGHYCYLDMDAQTQGCGVGYPQLYNELRTKSLHPFLSHQTCVKSTSGDPQISPWIRGCACASDHCNRYPSNIFDRDFEANVADQQAQQLPLVTCHSFADSSVSPIKIETYAERGFCKGHFCFLTLTTRQVVFESDDNINRYDDDEDNTDEEELHEERIASELKVTPYFHEKYDFTVGCLIVDNSNKVQLGCTTEYGENMSKIYTRHCICSGDYCNFYNLISGETSATLVPRRRLNLASGSNQKYSQKAFIFVSITSIIALLVHFMTLCMN